MAWRAIGARSLPVSFQPAAFKGALRGSLVLSKGTQSKFDTNCYHHQSHHGTGNHINSDSNASPGATSRQAARPQDMLTWQTTRSLQGVWRLHYPVDAQPAAYKGATSRQAAHPQDMPTRQATRSLQGVRLNHPVGAQPAAFRGALRRSLVLSKGIQSKFATTCCHFHSHHGSDSSSNSDNA